MTLNFEPLEKAIFSFEKAIECTLNEEKNPDNNKYTIQTLKAGVIQNFEFTYELSWKFIKRWLEQNLGSTYVDGVTRRQLFRLSNEHILIDDIEKWMEFHNARNRTSHIYDEEIAEEVYKKAVEFISYAKDLKKKLEAKND
jgi:nucleotidyltransferase substrate binding protein (TIGR01987 family)